MTDRELLILAAKRAGWAACLAKHGPKPLNGAQAVRFAEDYARRAELAFPDPEAKAEAA